MFLIEVLANTKTKLNDSVTNSLKVAIGLMSLVNLIRKEEQE